VQKYLIPRQNNLIIDFIGNLLLCMNPCKQSSEKQNWKSIPNHDCYAVQTPYNTPVEWSVSSR